MDSAAVELLRHRLEADWSRLTNEIAELREASKATTYLEDETGAYDQHMADDASAMTERQTDMSLLLNLERELTYTESALDRMESGVYGTCEVCGKPIVEQRLRARPAASTCIGCQTSIESRQRREMAFAAQRSDADLN